MNLLYRGLIEAIVDELGRLRGPASFVANDSTVMYTFDRRRKDLSGRTTWLTSQDQPTVSHRGSSRTRGVWRHLVRRDNESPYIGRSQRSHHSSASHVRS